jgi:hypothetical protein
MTFYAFIYAVPAKKLVIHLQRPGREYLLTSLLRNFCILVLRTTPKQQHVSQKYRID